MSYPSVSIGSVEASTSSVVYSLLRDNAEPARNVPALGFCIHRTGSARPDQPESRPEIARHSLRALDWAQLLQGRRSDRDNAKVGIVGIARPARSKACQGNSRRGGIGISE